MSANTPALIAADSFNVDTARTPKSPLASCMNGPVAVGCSLWTIALVVIAWATLDCAAVPAWLV